MEKRPQAPTSRKGIRSLPEISFHKGLNSLRTNRLLLEQGECATLLNPDLDVFGGMGIQKTIATAISGFGSIHSLYASGNIIWIGHGTSLSYYNTVSGASAVVTTGLSGDPLSMVAIANFIYFSNGTDKKKVYIPTFAVTEWGFDAPASAPTVAVGAAGNPSGTYSCYYSYVAKYADGTEYESDLSPVGSVTVTSEAITCTLPGSASDAQITHLRLYRDKTGLSQSLDVLRENVEAEEASRMATMAAAITEDVSNGGMGGTFGGFGAGVKTVINRTTNKKVVQDSITDQDVIVGPFQVAEVAIATTSYTDDDADATLQENIPFLRERYKPVETYTKILYRSKRIFGIGVTGYKKFLWFGQPYEPQALDASWDGYNTTTFEDDDNIALYELGGHIYIGGKTGFMRLRGTSPGDYVLDPTPATVGPESHEICTITPFGIIFPRRDGIYLFNGYTSSLIVPQVKDLLANVNWSSISVARAVWDGRFYRLFYPSGSATANDRELTLDFILGMQNVRCGEGDRAISAVVFDKATQTIYYGTSAGVLGTATGSGSRSFEITTKEYVSTDLLTSGTVGLLHYDVDTKGDDLTITPIYDGVDQATITLNHNGRTKSQVTLPKGQYYRLGFKIAATTDQDMVLYEPWLLE